MDENRVIGVDGELPWHHPEDLAHFRETTVSHPVIMGRVTYESIRETLGEPLPNRATIVLTSQDIDTSHPDVYAADGVAVALYTALAITEENALSDPNYPLRPDLNGDTVYVAGGGSVYEQLLPCADRLVLTRVHDTYDGDTYFPAFDRDIWVEVDREDGDTLSFVTYER